MELYSNKGIKDIITEFPRVGEILDEYGIGCGPCTVGICLLKDILFTFFDESEKIFQAIYEDHRIARIHVKEMLSAIEKKDVSSLSQHLTAYGNLLTKHIKKEDEILFPWLDRKLTRGQVIEL